MFTGVDFTLNKRFFFLFFLATTTLNELFHTSPTYNAT